MQPCIPVRTKWKWGAHPKDGTIDDNAESIMTIVKSVKPDRSDKYHVKCVKRRKGKKNWGCDDEFLKKVFLKKEEPLLAIIRSRPGQCGRAVGYVLEGKELDFYKRKIMEKKKGSSKK